MKHFILCLVVFLSIHSVKCQKSSFKKYFEKGTAAIKDTVICLNSSNKVWADLPIKLIKGSEKGPTFTILAGTGGIEYPATSALLQLSKEIDPKELKGNLIIISIADIKSFKSRTSFLNPLEIANLDHVFPGSAHGCVTEIIADFINTMVFDATDVFLDMNGVSAGEDLISFMGYYNNKEFPNQTQLASRLCEVSGLDSIVIPYGLASGEPAKCALKQAVRLGIPSLRIAVGGFENNIPRQITTAKNAVYRMMAELQLYKNAKIRRARSPKHRDNRQLYVTVPFQGLFHTALKAGDKIKEGQQIGCITDIFGSRIKTLTAPEKGTILYKASANTINTGKSCSASDTIPK